MSSCLRFQKSGVPSSPAERRGTGLGKVPLFRMASEIITQFSGTNCNFPFQGESIPIRLFLAGYDPTPTMRDVNKKFSVRYFLNLVLVDEEDRRYFKQQVWSKGISLQNSGVFCILLWIFCTLECIFSYTSCMA